jgi:hypothetical protein
MTFDKDKYWENRKEGKRGQGEVALAPAKGVTKLPENAQISFTNDGSMVINNRAYRRRTVSLFPKSSQLRKKNKRKK